jgi:hypothetical protein
LTRPDQVRTVVLMSTTVAGTVPLTAGMRRLLLMATALVTLAGVSLFVFPTRTAEWFAWTVEPPLTAAFLGAAYWASAVVEATSARARTWADARVAVPGVLVFTALTLVVTLVHLDRFHLGADVAPATRAIAAAWVAVYAVVPAVLAVLWLRQRRLPGADPPRTRPLPTWLRVAVGVMGAVLLAMGAALLLAPTAAAAAWPWELTPLTGRAIGAWLVGLAVSAAQTVGENDARRARPVAAGAVALAVLAALAVARFPGDLDGVGLPAVAFWLALAAWAALGAGILVRGARPPAGHP